MNEVGVQLRQTTREGRDTEAKRKFLFGIPERHHTVPEQKLFSEDFRYICKNKVALPQSPGTDSSDLKAK